MAHKRILVGIFLVGGVLLFAAGLFLIGSRKQVFSHHFDVYAGFNNIDTLTAGAKVRVSGMDAGSITDIDVPRNASARFRLKLKVDTKFHPIVRKDSTATIETEGMVGNKYIDIKKGSDSAPECPDGGYLPSQEPFEMADLMRQGGGLVKTTQATIEDLRKRADTTIRNIGSAAGHADQMIVSVRGDVKQIASHGAGIAKNADGIVANVRKGRGAAGKLLADASVASNIAGTIANAKGATGNFEQASQKIDAIATDVQQKELAQVQKTLENTRDMTSQLNQAVGTFLSKGNNSENTASALRDTVQGAQRAATNLADDTEAVKHNFFLRGFFKRRGFYSLDRLTPEEYASTEFVKKPRARVWIAAAGLFKREPSGGQSLSSEAHAILDQNMAELVSHLPNNPIMVEGYSAEGGPDQRYLSSKQRAAEARDYLESRFQLNPKLVGVIPLGDRPPAGTGKEIWDGICIALVASRR